MNCSKCGSPVSPNTSFCTQCGTPLNLANAPAQQITPPPDGQMPIDAAPRKKLPTSAVIAISGGAVLIVAIILFFVFLGPRIFGSGTQGSEQQSSPTAVLQGTPLRVQISQVDNADFPQVALYASIVDEAGESVASLDATQFTISEFDLSGTEYKGTIDELAPLAVGDAMNINLVIDQSGSMSVQKKMANAKTAASVFVSEIAENKSNSTEITAFDDYVYNRQPFTTDQILLKSAINSLSPDGETALYDALYWALQRTNLRSGSRVVIAFTDGEENASNYTAADVTKLSELTGIPVYIIGVGDSIDRSSLSKLASSCNGSYYDAATSNLATTLEEIYNSIYSNQRTMYRIVYTSSYTENQDVTRTIRLATTDSSPFKGSFERSYVPVDNVSASQNNSSVVDYVIPQSSSRYLTRLEVEGLSLWELYLARNEIFARHGRGFKNKDLVEYFATRHWYQQRYTPEQYDALGNQLNEYELKNVELMLGIEQERNSPYLVTAK